MRAVIWLDLDGTLLDVRARFCAVYAKVTSELSLTQLHPDEYWSLRCSGAGTRNILAATGVAGSYMAFVERRAALIESKQFLNHDSLRPGVKGALAALSSAHRLHLITARASRRNLIAQLRWLSIGDNFADIYTVPPDGGRHGKGFVLSNNASAHDLMVGDTPSDVQAGRDAGLFTCGVLGGMATANRLQDVTPDHIVASVSRLMPVLRFLDDNGSR